MRWRRSSRRPVALVVHSRRELGASLLPSAGGRATAPRTLGSPIGLAWRLQWPTLVAWAGGSALLGLALGSLVTAISGANLDNPQLQQIIQSLGHTSSTDVAQALVPALMVIVGAVAAAAGVQAVLRLREEESEGRAEAVLTAPVSRAIWLLSFAAIAAVSVTVVLSATGVASAVGFLALGDANSAWLSLAQAIVQIPAALTFVGIAALAVGLVPRASISLGWGLFGLGVGVGLFGDLLNLPDVVRHLSPISSAPSLPTDNWWPLVAVGMAAIILTALAVLAFRRRDLSA